MIEFVLTEVIWHYAIGTKGDRRYVIKQRKDSSCANDPTGGLGDYSAYVEELFMETWHIIAHTVRPGFSTYDDALRDIQARLREWH